MCPLLGADWVANGLLQRTVAVMNHLLGGGVGVLGQSLGLVPSDTACLASSPGRRLISLINKPYQDTGTSQICQKATGR